MISQIVAIGASLRTQETLGIECISKSGEVVVLYKIINVIQTYHVIKSILKDFIVPNVT